MGSKRGTKKPAAKPQDGEQSSDLRSAQHHASVPARVEMAAGRKQAPGNQYNPEGKVGDTLSAMPFEAARELVEVHLQSLDRMQASALAGVTLRDQMKTTKLRDSSMFRVLAASGVPWAQVLLGDYLMNTKGRRKSAFRAVESYEQAATQGHGLAQFRLALCWANGLGVEQNDTAAAEWLTKAAEAGVVDAQYWLGRFYEVGRGVPKDGEQAIRWYRTASEGHSLDAAAAMACVALKTAGRTRDKPPATGEVSNGAE